MRRWRWRCGRRIGDARIAPDTRGNHKLQPDWYRWRSGVHDWRHRPRPGQCPGCRGHPAHRWEHVPTGLPGECLRAHRTLGQPVIPPGLNSTYQLTAVGSFTEVVTSLTRAGRWRPSQWRLPGAEQLLRALLHNRRWSPDNLAGTGFNVGTLILAGTPPSPAASVGVYSLATDSAGAPVTTQFDQSPSIITRGVTTVAGSGSALLSSDVTYINPAFFKTPLSQITFNSSLVTPFLQVTPSASLPALPVAAAPNVTPDIGTINGVNGTDFQLQADANFSFTRPSPNPPASSRQVWACSGFWAWRLGCEDEK